MSSNPAFTSTDDIDRERLHWTIGAGSGEHVLDLIPGVLGSVAVEVDGITVAHLPKPAPQRPWRDARIEIDGEHVDVVLIWTRSGLTTDVFVGGRSLRDRTTLDQARAAGPRRATGDETWIGGLFRERVPPRRPSVTPWMAIFATVSALALGVVVIWMVRPSGLLAALVVGVAMIAFFFAWFLSWTTLTARVHLALLARPELGDQQRVAWFTAALLGYPVLSVGLVVLVYGVARTLGSG